MATIGIGAIIQVLKQLPMSLILPNTFVILTSRKRKKIYFVFGGSITLSVNTIQKEENAMIDVLIATHGAQEGAQAQFNHSTHKWTVWTKQGLERTYSDIVSYARYMTRGY